MEQESAFISSGAGLKAIQRLVYVCYDSIIVTKECAVELDEGNTLFLKLQKEVEVGPLPRSWQVPIATTPLSALDMKSWDLTIVRVTQLLDGKRCIRDIAHQAKMDVPLVCHAVR